MVLSFEYAMVIPSGIELKYVKFPACDPGWNCPLRTPLPDVVHPGIPPFSLKEQSRPQPKVKPPTGGVSKEELLTLMLLANAFETKSSAQTKVGIPNNLNVFIRYPSVELGELQRRDNSADWTVDHRTIKSR